MKYIIGLTMFIIGTVIINELSIAFGVAIMIWGWDVSFNNSLKTVDPIMRSSKSICGTAGEYLIAGDAVVFGEDGRIYKAGRNE